MSRRMRLPSDQELMRRLRTVNDTSHVVKYLHPLIMDELRIGGPILETLTIITHIVSALESYASDYPAALPASDKASWLELYLKALITDRSMLNEALGTSARGRPRR